MSKKDKIGILDAFGLSDDSDDDTSEDLKANQVSLEYLI